MDPNRHSQKLYPEHCVDERAGPFLQNRASYSLLQNMILCKICSDSYEGKGVGRFNLYGLKHNCSLASASVSLSGTVLLNIPTIKCSFIYLFIY